MKPARLNCLPLSGLPRPALRASLPPALRSCADPSPGPAGQASEKPRSPARPTPSRTRRASAARSPCPVPPWTAWRSVARPPRASVKARSPVSAFRYRPGRAGKRPPALRSPRPPAALLLAAHRFPLAAVPRGHWPSRQRQLCCLGFSAYSAPAPGLALPQQIQIHFVHLAFPGSSVAAAAGLGADSSKSGLVPCLVGRQSDGPVPVTALAPSHVT